MVDRVVHVTLHYDVRMTDEDRGEYAKVDHGCDPDVIVFWAKKCAEKGELHGCNGIHIGPDTNGDRIRSMTDYELADILHNAGGNWYSYEYWLDWLRQEAGV